MALNLDHLLKTADTLEQALIELARVPADKPVLFDLYRNAAIKSFELSLETSGKLLRRALKLFASNPRVVDALVFNDVLRQAGKHGIFDQAMVERWLAYRANRSNTAHDCDEEFANQTLKLLPDYLEDLRALTAKLGGVFNGQPSA